MAKAMVRRAIAEKIPFRWVTADATYGFSQGRRSELERADVFHVMAANRHDTVVTRWAIDHPVHDLRPGLPRQKWKRRSCGDGAHGRRVYDWARVEVRPWHQPDRRHYSSGSAGVARHVCGELRRQPWVLCDRVEEAERNGVGSSFGEPAEPPVVHFRW